MTKHLTIIRSADEIAARIEQVKDEDWLGTESADLLVHLPYEQAKPFIKEGTTEAEFAAVIAEDLEADLQHAAITYLDFAIGKIQNHRGISAGRSVSHFRAWLWLLLPDDQFDLFENAEYPQYGAPKVKAAAQLLGADLLWVAAVEVHPELARMGAGNPCTPDCIEGCGS